MHILDIFSILKIGLLSEILEFEFSIAVILTFNLNMGNYMCVCVCVCVCMFMWFMRTQMCIMAWV